MYINALEQRVADLESKMLAKGHGSASEDHLRSGGADIRHDVDTQFTFWVPQMGQMMRQTKLL